MNWPALMRLAALRFGIGPAAFWALSLAEWRALTAATPSAAALSRGEFERLLAAHPDAPAREAP